MSIKILVCYFDQVAGPKILTSNPSQVSISDTNAVNRLFDLDLEPPFFEVKHDDEVFINFKFEILSEKARGGFELLLITVILNKEQTYFNWKKELLTISEQIKSIPHILEMFATNAQSSPIIQMKLSNIERFLRQTLNNYKEYKEAHPYGQLLFLGIEKVGKTSIIERLKSGTFSPQKRPTLGTQILRTAIEHFQFQIHDVGGQKTIRQTWFKSSKKPDAIIYVIDVSSPPSRDQEYTEEFERIIRHYFPTPLLSQANHVPILILLNKVDLIEANEMDSYYKRFSALLTVEQLVMPHAMKLVSAKTNMEILSSFRWLMSQILIE